MNWKNKNVLITGSDGMIGRELDELLSSKGARITRADLKLGHDLRYYDTCKSLCQEKDFVFHLAGIKGNPQMTKEQPAEFMKMIQFDSNMIMAAHYNGVKRFLYTSSIAVENPKTDKYPAWAKLTGEKIIEALRIQKSETDYCIVRPSNVYGRYDGFDNPNAMVITKLIREALDTNKIILDKKGSKQERDFINARDVARGMIKAMELMPDIPVNLCSGIGFQIKQIAELISKQTNCVLIYKDLNLVLGPDKKVMKNPFVTPKISYASGIKEVVNYANLNWMPIKKR